MKHVYKNIAFYIITCILLSYAKMVHKFLDIVQGFLQISGLVRNRNVFETNETMNLRTVAPGNNQLTCL